MKPPRTFKLRAALVALGLAAGLLVATATAAQADPGPIVQPSTAQVTADALPTVQIDGVAWSQAVVGNTVYAGGKFGTARPAGAAPGVNTVIRNNLLSYNITNGVLNSTFVPNLNGQVLAVAASPDGSRIYVGGDFTTANGLPHNRIAAYSTVTGALILSFNADVDAQVRGLVATNSTVYAGGVFSHAGGVAHARVAAFSAVDGSVLPWSPSADAQVNAVVLTPDSSKLIIGGAFENVNGTPQYGMAAIDASSGAVLPWPANRVVHDATANSAILNLTTDGTSIFGTGYVFHGGGNLEGAFRIDPDSGQVIWVEDCHGDSYGTYAFGSALYVASHSHYCANLGAFPQPDVLVAHRATAFTLEATGTAKQERGTYHNWEGTPSPSQLNWYPDMSAGTATGQNQGPWNVSGNKQYVVYAGEFPKVNDVGQQGLVRFTVPSNAPNAQGPRIPPSQELPQLIALSTGSVRVAFQSSWDRDDKNLSYQITRDGVAVYSTTTESEFWNRPYLGFTDTGLAPGSTHSYRLSISDPDGNKLTGSSVPITLPTSVSPSSYASKVIADGASSYWPLDESSGSTVFDHAGYNDATAGTIVKQGLPGAIPGENATGFVGSVRSSVYTNPVVDAPNTYTASLWVNTTSTTGGQLLGFGSAQTTASLGHDRQVWMDDTGRVNFAVLSGPTATTLTPAALATPTPLNDGRWHQVAVSLSAGGMSLYVDGTRVANRTDVTKGSQLSGYWRIGSDDLTGLTPQPTNDNFTGSLAAVAIFPTELASSTVAAEYVASGRSFTGQPSPTDSYGAAVFADDPQLYWRLNEAAGSTVAADSGANRAAGDYLGAGTVKGVTGALTANADKAVTFSGGTDHVASQTTSVNPTTLTEEGWFKTTSTSGGKVIGLGNAQTGNSTSFDREVLMANNGTLAYRINTGTSRVSITTSRSYNDGLWHQVVGTLSAGGMQLYVDGGLVGSNPNTVAQNLTGYWRVGGDTTGTTTSGYLAGSIDEVAIYDRVLSALQVARHYHIGSTGNTGNIAPTASFTSTVAGLKLSVNGSGATDLDGSISSWAWNFGDGSTATGAVPPAHTYATAGTYNVRLTVTDNQGATSMLIKLITTQTTYATDSFTRTVTAGWGSADTGGAWTPLTVAPAFTVNGSSGRVAMTTAGTGPSAYLNSVSAVNIDGTVDAAMNTAATGAGAYLTLSARHLGTSEYRVRVKLQPTQSILVLTKVVNGTETILASAGLPGLVYAADTVLRIRLQLIGTGPTTLSGKVWPTSQAEPATFQASVTDAEPSLQNPGSVGIGAYVSPTSTVPVIASFDNLSMTSPQS